MANAKEYAVIMNGCKLSFYHKKDDATREVGRLARLFSTPARVIEHKPSKNSPLMRKMPHRTRPNVNQEGRYAAKAYRKLNARRTAHQNIKDLYAKLKKNHLFNEAAWTMPGSMNPAKQA